MLPCFKTLCSVDEVFDRSDLYSLGELDGYEEWGWRRAGYYVGNTRLGHVTVGLRLPRGYALLLTFAAVGTANGLTDATLIDLTSIKATPNGITISDAVSTITALDAGRSTITHPHSNADATSSVPRQLAAFERIFPLTRVILSSSCVAETRSKI